MINKNRLKGVVCIIALLVLSVNLPRACAAPRTSPLVADHNAVMEFDQIPREWIEKAKQDFRIFYGHTSHGSQIVTGMSALRTWNNLYSYNSGAGSLSLVENSSDLGNPSTTAWAATTRTQLNRADNDRNMFLWSWCGQVSGLTSTIMQTDYLNSMNQLELDYPNAAFIYMTGHLDGTGAPGNLNQRNNQIRDFARTNNKVLFDFSDIESYDPSKNEFMTRCAHDGCYYSSTGSGSCSGVTRDRNWATDWWNANPAVRPYFPCAGAGCGCAHTESLNCDLKGRAFWWLLARLAGWPGVQGYGDVSGDGRVSAYDAALAAQHAVGLITLTSEQITRADVSGGGGVSAYDAALIAQYAVGLITKFPVEG